MPPVDSVLRELLLAANDQGEEATWSALSDWLVDHDQEELSELVQLGTIPWLSGREEDRLAALRERAAESWGNGEAFQIRWEKDRLLPVAAVGDPSRLSPEAVRAIEQGWIRSVILPAPVSNGWLLPRTARLTFDLSWGELREDVGILQGMPHLWGLILGGRLRLTQECLDLLARLPNLHSFELDRRFVPLGVREMSLETFPLLEDVVLATNEQLTSLTVAGARVQLPELPAVPLHEFLSRDDPGFDLADCVGPAPGAPRLRHLDLRRTPLAHRRLIGALRPLLPGCKIRF